MDYKIGKYTTKPKSSKWTMVANSYVLETARVNASAIYALHKKMDPKKLSSYPYF